MHGPIGRWGVQALPNSGQSYGSCRPRITSPHLQPGVALSGPEGHAEPLAGIIPAVLRVENQAAAGDHADRAPVGIADLEDLVDEPAGGGVALGADGGAVDVADGRTAVGDLLDDLGQAGEHLVGLEASDDAGLVVLLDDRACRHRRR